MRSTFTRAAAAAVVVGLAAGLSACASGAPASDSKVSSLTVWINGDDGPNFKKLVAPFTKDTGIAIDVVSIPFANVNEKLTTAVASGNGPDVAQVGLSFLPSFAGAHALAPLTPFLKEHPDLAADNFPAGALTSSGGQYVGVPWTSDTRVLFYRSDILEQAGIATPPATWTDVRTDAKTLASRGAGKYGYYIPQWDSALPVAMTWSDGGQVVDKQGRLDFSGGAFSAAASTYLGLYSDGSVPTNGDFDQVQGFVSGTTPMLVSGPYFAAAVKAAAPQLDGKWNVSAFPKGTKSSTSLFAGSDMAIWSKTTKKQAAAQFLSFLSQKKIQLDWYRLSGALPALNAALADPSIASDPLARVYTTQLKTARALPAVTNWDGGAGADLLKALNSIALQHADRATTLKRMAAQAASQSTK